VRINGKVCVIEALTTKTTTMTFVTKSILKKNDEKGRGEFSTLEVVTTVTKTTKTMLTITTKTKTKK